MALSPIRVVGKAAAAMYFQRGEVIRSIEQVAELREFRLVLPTGDNYPHAGRPVTRSYAFDETTQTIEVTVEFPNPNFLLRPGLDGRRPARSRAAGIFYPLRNVGLGPV